MPAHRDPHIDSWTPQSYLKWCHALIRLRRYLEEYFIGHGFAPMCSPTVQPSIGFDPTNTVYRIENPDGPDRFLRTSPERGLKIMLSASRQSLFEIGTVFRGGGDNGSGPVHVHEFSMCEWYEIDTTIADGIARTQDVLAVLWSTFERPKQEFCFQIRTFDDLFEEAMGQSLNSWLEDKPDPSINDALDFVYADRFLPIFKAAPGFVATTLFPIQLAALARPHPPTQHLRQSQQRFQRWEINFKGIELANGYAEITDFEQLKDVIEHQERFEAHRLAGGPLFDPQLLEAFCRGLPPSSGCALGIDRLLMVLLGQDKLGKFVQSK